jgi:hypothetical protein
MITNKYTALADAHVWKLGVKGVSGGGRGEKKKRLTSVAETAVVAVLN